MAKVEVKVQVGRELTIKSLQDTHNYYQDMKSLGIDISTDETSIETSAFSYNKDKTDSRYVSAINLVDIASNLRRFVKVSVTRSSRIESNSIRRPSYLVLFGIFL